MYPDRFKKTYEIKTSKKVDEIINDIRTRAERQKKNKISLIWELVDYNKFGIKGNLVEIERFPTPFNPFKGQGTITFELQALNNETTIKCTINPYVIYTIGGIGLFAIFSMIFTIVIVFAMRKFAFLMIIFILIAWIVPIGMGYFGFRFHRSNLFTYSKTILQDLGILTTGS